MNIKLPLQADARGRTAAVAADQHIRDLIEQVLFTAPGERVNRPAFGSGLQQLVFQPNGGELAATVQFLVQGALQQWLGDIIEAAAVQITTEEATLAITVVYTVRQTQQRQVAQFTRQL